MKIIETGTTYKIYGEDLIVLENLPAQTYKVGFSKFTGFFLEKQANLEIKEEKIYGVHESKVRKVLNRFKNTNKNLGVILSGDKGIGKSLFARLLSNEAIENGMPVILVNEYIPGISDFINSIQNEVLVLFDEFDKTFASADSEDPQAQMLSLFDGTSHGKKLFVITCNKYRSLNEYLINRPGRFHYHFRFNYPTAEEVREYLLDKLAPEYHSEIHKVVAFSKKIKLNYDCLSAIALELNDGETFEDAIMDLNIVNTGEKDTTYSVTVYTQEGFTFCNESVSLNLFGTNRNRFWVDDNANNSINIVFLGKDAIYEKKTNSFVVSGDAVKVDFNEDYIDESHMDVYKNMHITYVKIALNYDMDIHYIA